MQASNDQELARKLIFLGKTIVACLPPSPSLFLNANFSAYKYNINVNTEKKKKEKNLERLPFSTDIHNVL